MKKVIFLTFIILLLGKTIFAQSRVAGYSYGKPGTDNYEQLTFWTTDGERSKVYYTYGKDRKEVEVQYIGTEEINGSMCFKIQFANKFILFITPNVKKLLVSDVSSKYNKIFLWEYEGPVNGIGTYCDICVEDEDEAMKLIETSYLK
ncbi:MAG: hypothetical protein EOP00_32030 [Pedobacter sp.]|nr:MAG: hypothetical protein EOP00_32030 [Pedobacter sp.]